MQTTSRAELTGRGSVHGRDLEHWLQAEREVFMETTFGLSERDGNFEVHAAIAGVEPKDIDIEVTPEDIVLKPRTNTNTKSRKALFTPVSSKAARYFVRVICRKKSILTRSRQNSRM